MRCTKLVENSLFTVTEVFLGQHNLLSHHRTLLNGAESYHIGNTWIRLLVAMRNTHATANCHVEAG